MISWLVHSHFNATVPGPNAGMCSLNLVFCNHKFHGECAKYKVALAHTHTYVGRLKYSSEHKIPVAKVAKKNAKVIQGNPKIGIFFSNSIISFIF